MLVVQRILVASVLILTTSVITGAIPADSDRHARDISFPRPEELQADCERHTERYRHNCADIPLDAIDALQATKNIRIDLIIFCKSFAQHCPEIVIVTLTARLEAGAAGRREDTRQRKVDAIMRSDDARMRTDDARLRKADATLRLEAASERAAQVNADAEGRTDDANMRRDDAKMRKLDARMRKEDAKLRSDAANEQTDTDADDDADAEERREDSRLRKVDARLRKVDANNRRIDAINRAEAGGDRTELHMRGAPYDLPPNLPVPMLLLAPVPAITPAPMGCDAVCKCHYWHAAVVTRCSPPADSRMVGICQAWYVKCPMYHPLNYG